MQNLLTTNNEYKKFHQEEFAYCYKIFGAHIVEQNGQTGVEFSVWAPNAKKVSVVGNFNDWNDKITPMKKINGSGVWTIFVPDIGENELYKYLILTKDKKLKYVSDPYAFFSELRPNTASIIYSLENYEWQDYAWQSQKKNLYQKPINIYEVHFGSWKKNGDQFYTYKELADKLIDYVVDMGYTHIELLPIVEHPYDRSWGYQITGYYSITSRYGTPHDFMYFVDQCHQKGIGVIVDWVPGHFVKDEHGLRNFDGEPLYEHSDSRRAENYNWGTLSFDLGKTEVVNFLISNAMFLLDIYHVDGLRVDAVSSILYLDFDKRDKEWIPNIYGGNQNLEGIAFLKKLNEKIFEKYPNALMIAEESTAWPLVSAPTFLGGLGFNYKWNMGWMNDVLSYMEMDPIYRKFYHDLLTFSFFYVYSENYILSLSHDEVVHGKRSLLNKMFGDYWQKFASLRLLYGYMIAHPGKKLLFMGGEYGQYDEWKDYQELDWNLVEYDSHRNLHLYVKELNHFYKREKIFWELDYAQDGFEWIDPHDTSQSIISFIRKNKKGNFIVIVCNFTPFTYDSYIVGVPYIAEYREIFNSDLGKYGGSDRRNISTVKGEKKKWHNQPYSINITIPPLAVIMFKATNYIHFNKLNNNCFDVIKLKEGRNKYKASKNAHINKSI